MAQIAAQTQSTLTPTLSHRRGSSFSPWEKVRMRALLLLMQHGFPDHQQRRSIRSTLKALAASAGLSALFLVVYGWCNWFTSQRSDVGTLFFEWERLIPFVPLMIAPYMSIDLFFIAAPFLCRSDRELATFSRRIAAAILVAGICFLLFPLRFAFD